MYGKGSNMSGARNNAPMTPWPMPKVMTAKEIMDEADKKREASKGSIPPVPKIEDWDEEVEF